MGEGIVLISLSGVVLGDLVWGTIGRSWRGGGWSCWCFFVFSDVAAPFFGRERPRRREKIRSDLKKYNASWSL
jgi:hypothetical protein